MENEGMMASSLRSCSNVAGLLHNFCILGKEAWFLTPIGNNLWIMIGFHFKGKNFWLLPHVGKDMLGGGIAVYLGGEKTRLLPHSLVFQGKNVWLLRHVRKHLGEESHFFFHFSFLPLVEKDVWGRVRWKNFKKTCLLLIITCITHKML